MMMVMRRRVIMRVGMRLMGRVIHGVRMLSVIVSRMILTTVLTIRMTVIVIVRVSMVMMRMTMTMIMRVSVMPTIRLGLKRSALIEARHLYSKLKQPLWSSLTLYPHTSLVSRTTS